MSKKNLFNKSVLSITKRIESFFNFFRENFSSKKKYSKNFKVIDKRIFISLGIIFILIISYLIIPAFYDKNKIKAELENQILDQYNLKVKFEQPLKYGLFPKPYFYSKNTIINYRSSDVAKSNNSKIFISIKNFFSSDDIEIKNLIFKNSEFKIDNSNFKFFIDLLNDNNSSQNIKFLNSKLFYLDKNEDVIFLANVKDLNFLYQDSFLQKLNSKFEIFTIPVNLKTEHSTVEKNFITEIKLNPLRLNLKNILNYKDETLNGQLELSIVNKSKKINYSLKNNLFNFNTSDDKITGNILVKPFFLSSNLNLSQIDLKKIFKNNSIPMNILNSEILNNKNLNGKITVDTNSFNGVNFLNNIKFNILLNEGDIYIQNLKTTFKDSVIINLSDTQLIVDGNELNFAGYINLDFINVDNFYAHYQINKKDRKDIKKINFGFLFNLNEKFVEIDNLKVDENFNQSLDEFLENFNSKKVNIFNKVIFRNSIKGFFNKF